MKKVYLVDYDLCNLRFCGRQCIKKCPITQSNARLKPNKKKQEVPIWLQKSTKRIRIQDEGCLKCGICANMCPPKAIYIKYILEEPTSLTPTIKYPDNGEKEGFRLYNLPTLLSGKVSGLCGPNGIGKTTVLNLISGNLLPNFGQVDLHTNKIQWETVIKNIRESEMRNHFSALSQNDRKIAYKHQVLRVLFDKYKGKRVEDILKAENEVSSLFLNGSVII
jgi:ATP-binding cassette subfamily E protein 1